MVIHLHTARDGGIHMKRNLALAVVAVAVIIAASRPAQADGSIPIILGPAFSYNLIGVPLTATGGPAPINPGVLVGLNPQPLPPLPDPGANVSLINPSDPLYTYPGVGLQTFEVEWGMNAGGPVSFTPPTPGPNDPLQQTFNGTAPGGEVYAVTFNLGGADPGSFVELNPQPLPPFPAPGFGFEIFTFTAGGDPTLSFSVTSNGTTFEFSPAPEPSSLLLLGSGLAALAGMLRRKLRA